MADIGWITGHSYIVYGPLALAATSVIYEGVPVFPDAGRAWRVAERLGVNIFHTSPTAIRMLRKSGPDEPAKYSYHFKHMTTVGEPIEPEVWKWYYNAVGKREAVIVDTWWQTENGGFLCSTKPALDPMKPGSAGPGVPGIYPIIYDEEGEEVKAGSGKAGNICIRNPWPGIFQTIWGDRERFVRQYYSRYCKDTGSKDWHDWPYFAADGAVLAADGSFRILGRVDDVINVAGHRLGTKELESACLAVPEVAEAAVVPVVTRSGRVQIIALKPGYVASKEITDKVIAVIESRIGKIARPKRIHIVPDMPKTRSGKIMRRVLAAISNTLDTGDITTLANPDIVEQIRVSVQGKEKVATKEGPEDLKQFGKEVADRWHGEGTGGRPRNLSSPPLRSQSGPPVRPAASASSRLLRRASPPGRPSAGRTPQKDRPALDEVEEVLGGRARTLVLEDSRRMSPRSCRWVSGRGAIRSDGCSPRCVIFSPASWACVRDSAACPRIQETIGMRL
jgi:hypothetical protein